MKPLFPRIRLLPFFFALLLVLNGCAGGNNWGYGTNTATRAPQQLDQTAVETGAMSQAPQAPDMMTQGRAIKIGFLAPLSGQGADTGQALVNAAQLAIFDMPHTGVELLPRDTKGTPQGAYEAGRAALADGADILLGPLFAEDVRQVSRLSTPTKPVVGFTNDWTAASGTTFVMGFLPHAQVERVLAYAAQGGGKRFLMVVNNDAYGSLVASAGQRYLQGHGLPPAEIVTYQGAGQTANAMTQKLYASGTNTYDGVLMALGGAQSAELVRATTKMGTHLPQLYGTGLWDDEKTASIPDLNGAIYAGPTPTFKSSFESKYRSVYGNTPPRIASLGYDATALVLTLAKRNVRPSADQLVNPNGFSGLDGIFRFRNDGLIDRSLSILQIQSGSTIVRQEASLSFVRPRP